MSDAAAPMGTPPATDGSDRLPACCWTCGHTSFGEEPCHYCGSGLRRFDNGYLPSCVEVACPALIDRPVHQLVYDPYRGCPVYDDRGACVCSALDHGPCNHDLNDCPNLFALPGDDDYCPIHGPLICANADHGSCHPAGSDLRPESNRLAGRACMRSDAVDTGRPDLQRRVGVSELDVDHVRLDTLRPVRRGGDADTADDRGQQDRISPVRRHAHRWLPWLVTR